MRSAFTVRLKFHINRSAIPFVDGRYGAPVPCLIPFAFMDLVKALDVNWRTLSYTSCCGILTLAISIHVCATVSSAVVLFISTISGHLLYASTNTRYVFPNSSPAKSTCNCRHCEAGYSHRCIGARLELLAIAVSLAALGKVLDTSVN